VVAVRFRSQRRKTEVFSRLRCRVLSVKILLVEDDIKVGRFLIRTLSDEGFSVDHCKNGADAIAQAASSQFDLIVLDWMLPDIDGLTVCRSVRSAGVTAPILMLTARGESKEKVLGLENGADDYMVKPFEIDELLARVRALIRRTQGFAKMKCGDLEVDRVGHQVALLGQSLSLTTREYALLLYLMHRVNKVVTRGELLAHVWDTTFDPGSNLVEVHISRLREKLGLHTWMVETVRGSGYRMRSEPPS
jgi:DNA-binding response OmpR family regulator